MEEVSMKRIKVTDHSKCFACMSCMMACAGAFYKGEDFDPDKSCIQMGLKGDGTIQVRTCLQCGKCAKACEQGAITQNAKGVYMINKKLCIGCGKCTEVCPMKVMVKAGDKVSKCISCGICVKACPVEILEVFEK